MFKVEIASGLPVYGPRAIAFPDPSAFREGLVVNFVCESGDAWIGNFAKFFDKGFDCVLTDLGPTRVLVVAGYAAYLIDVEQQALVMQLGCDIKRAWYSAGQNAFILSNDLWFEAHGMNGALWRSRRISLDGLRDLEIYEAVVSGEALDVPATEDSWVPFKLDLETGQTEGGMKADLGLKT